MKIKGADVQKIKTSLKLNILSVVLVIVCASVGLNVLSWAGNNEPFEISWDNKTVKIYRPFQIYADYYCDGGTIGVTVNDKWGNTLLFCLDARMEIIELPDTNKTGIGATLIEGYKHLYLGARYPTDMGAYKVDISGKEEKQILGILENWKIERASKIGFEKITSYVDHPRMMNMTDQDLSDAHVLSVIRILRKRN